MFNLLPENLKEKIKKEYKLRLTIIAILFVIIAQLTFLIFLLPSWLNSYYKQKEYSGRKNEVSNFLSSLDISSTTAYIKSTNSILTIINDSLDYPKMSPVVMDILSKKKSSIKIGGIFYSVNSGNSATLSINGLASNREALVSFSDSLKEIEYFKKVDLPISNLAKDKNIDFSINVNIEK